MSDSGREAIEARQFRRPLAIVDALADAAAIMFLGRAPKAGRPVLLHAFVPLGLAIGLSYALLYRAAWRVFGETNGLRLLPAAAVWLAGLLIFERVQLTGVIQCACGAAAGDRTRLGTVPRAALPIAVAAVILPLVLWLAIPNASSTWPGIWGTRLNFAYPRVLFRPLILAPMWAAWGWVAAAGIGGAGPAVDARVRRLELGGSPLKTLLWLVPVMLLTMVYSGTGGRWTIGALISLGVFGLTNVCAIATARRWGGQTPDTAAASAWVARTMFLILYLAARHRLYHA